MRNILFICLLFCYLGGYAQQVVSAEELQDLLNSTSIPMEKPDVGNLSMIRQIDQSNIISVIQSQEGILQNNILLNQNGTDNSAFINQTGSGLETKLWQYKLSNKASLWSEGKDVAIEVKQDGIGNSINSFIENYVLVSRSAYLLQQGDNNRIELALFGDGIPVSGDAQQIQISQTGNNHRVDALLENIFDSLTIIQTPGVNGEGMQVNISNSAFSFPMRK